jgi:folylpolyglutamate synthase/dihydropteroate synthase
MEVLRTKGFNIPDSAIESGLLIKQPCRMEELPLNLKPNWSAGKRFFFDVGHNPNAVERML